MPPTEVRPQTFDSTSRFHKLGEPQHGSTSFQSPDSASPAVRLEKSKLTLRSEPAVYPAPCSGLRKQPRNADQESGLKILPWQALLPRTLYLQFSRYCDCNLVFIATSPYYNN